MTTLKPRDPYSKDELKILYPDGLKLQFVEVLHRHGERTPVVPRFQNTGLPKFWPYCSVAREMVAPTLEINKNIEQWSSFRWQRQIETIGHDDRVVSATGPDESIDSLCKPGELTDTGRNTTYNLGKRLRHLYVDQLNFLPNTLSDANIFYLRCSPVLRTLESLQQVLRGLYPANTRASSLGQLTIKARIDGEENLISDRYNCQRFSQLYKAFTERSEKKWNKSTEMEYLNKLLSKWMPEESKTVAVNSKPRLSGILDTVNSTLAHGPETKLPSAFYDSRALEFMDKICQDEWYSGYKESQEFRALGIGSLMGDIVDRMVNSVESFRNSECPQIDDPNNSVGKESVTNNAAKFALIGCHDVTLTAILCSLGAFENKTWSPYSSQITFELFRKSPNVPKFYLEEPASETRESLGNIVGDSGGRFLEPTKKSSLVRKKMKDFSEEDRLLLDGYFVSVRYNDEVVKIPGCAKAGSHLPGNTGFCTLEAFKSIVDKFVPISRKIACNTNLDAPPFPETPEPAGY